MISYIGGKSNIAKSLIIPNIPKNIETYCEVFSGMYWTFFKINIQEFPNLKNVIYNDINILNVNLFNCVKNHEMFYQEISKIPSQNKELFDEFQREIFDPYFEIDLSQPDFHSAIAYSYILTQNWSGTNPSTSKFIDLKGKYKSKFDTFKDKLQNINWQKHFDRIDLIENLDFEEIIEKHDSENSFFYCDPPYMNCEKYYANHEFNPQSHERLAKTLQNIKGKFALSYYYFPQLEEWFPKNKYHWEQKDFAKAASAKIGVKQNKGTELLIMNY